MTDQSASTTETVEESNIINSVQDVEQNKVIHGMYYPHIDGIRALAVIPVVLFHILAILCPGGFAGVDVFFVISGYLITGGIIRDINKGQFTIANFYHRRIRRILPAYFTLITGVLLTGFFVYYATPTLSLCDASIMGTLFSSNIFFWINSGNYFAPDTHTNPLLHLWSLSVEEQFYLFIPLLCVIIWKLRRGFLLPIFTIIAGLSLFGAIHVISSGKAGDAFFLLQFRAWELLAGSLLAIIASPLMVNKSKILDKLDRHSSVIAAIGCVLVIVPYLLLSDTTPFPGATAIPSVLGTALLIRYGNSGIIGRLLTYRPCIIIGKISYSLYLWHWPVTVFWKYMTYDTLYAFDYVGMFLVSLLLGYLSWKFVEMPVRVSNTWTRKTSFAFAGIGIFLLVGIGYIVVSNKGFPDLLHREANKYVSPINLETSYVNGVSKDIQGRLGLSNGNDLSSYNFRFGMDGTFSLGNTGKPDIFLIGDSHAGALRYGLDKVIKENNGCGLSFTVASTDLFNLSLPHAKNMLEMIDKHPTVTKVIVVEYWISYKTRQRKQKEPDYAMLEEFIQVLQSRNKKVFIIADLPNYPKNNFDFLAKSSIIPPRTKNDNWKNWQSVEEYENKQGAINSNLKCVCNETSAVYVPIQNSLFDGSKFITSYTSNEKYVSLYKDANHLSPEGSERAARYLWPYLYPSD
jgi:peptidoglycan/LPS O-acetylase OafA/YrhL